MLAKTFFGLIVHIPLMIPAGIFWIIGYSIAVMYNAFISGFKIFNTDGGLLQHLKEK